MTLFPKLKNPYFIVTPPYNHYSSGVRTLHLLCHALNEIGERAYIALTENPPNINPVLLTPLLTSGVVDFYKDKKIDPVVIYPDIIQGNPLGANKVVRYLLAPAGAYGGDMAFPETDIIWACTKAIANQSGGKTLILPSSDRAIFHTPKVDLNNMTFPKRKGSCFYAHKYDKIHGQELLTLSENSKRLEGSLEEIAEILRTSEVCYVYEFSNIIIEAGLCGCPVVLIRTPYFNKLGEPDWHWPHVMWSDEIKNLSVTWPLEVLRDYKEKEQAFWEQLKEFVKETQNDR